MTTKVAVVTGSSRGIGKATAQNLASNGWTVVLHGSSQSENTLKNTTAKLAADNNQTHSYVIADLPEQAEVIAAHAINKHGRIDALINNAGVLGDLNFEEVDAEDIRRVIDVNFTAPMLISKDCFNHMKNGAGGSIVNISSFTIAYGMGRNQTLHYASSKAALESMSTGLSRIGAKYNIRSNCIRPGIVMTDQQKDRPNLEDRLKMIPLGRMSEPNEIAEFVNYLLSEQASLVTGQTITLSGGE